MKKNLYAELQRPEKRGSSWEEGLSSLPEGEWAVADKATKEIEKQTKEIEKESINIFFFWYNL